jgi:membrane carboxypeptidase/penicillin-binding protein PbpC
MTVGLLAIRRFCRWCLIGNAENEALKQVTGQSGAGAIWHDTMNLLLESSYNHKTTIDTTLVTLFPIKNSEEWGLKDDMVLKHQTLLLEDSLILSPYEHDTFELFMGGTIPLRGSKELEWSVNGEVIGLVKDTEFKPTYAGNYEIMAVDKNSSTREIIQISVINSQ